MSPGFATTPEPPYYAVIFTSTRHGPSAGGATAANDDGYDGAAARMEALARTQPGFLGIESARDGLGITVSYWRDLASIAAWKADAEHTAVREMGRSRWYDRYVTRVCLVERAYDWDRPDGALQTGV